MVDNDLELDMGIHEHNRAATRKCDVQEYRGSGMINYKYSRWEAVDLTVVGPMSVH